MPAVFTPLSARLVVRSWNSLSGLILLVAGRLRDASGQIQTFQFTHTPATDRSKLEQTFDLIAGQLLDVSVTPQTGTPRRGQCFVTIGLGLREHPTTKFYQDLAKGYVTSIGGVIWPGGPYLDSVEGPGILRSVAGTDPAAGAEIIETVPTNTRWRVRTLRASLVTDATVPVRTVNFIVDDATTTLLNFPGVTTQAASLTRAYNVAEYAFQPSAVGTDIFFYIPLFVYLFQGWRILTSTTNLVAGDNWGAPQMEVEEWIEE